MHISKEQIISMLQVRNCEGFHVLFRGNTLATKVTTFCFKIYGSNYIHYLLGPLIKPLLKQENLNTTFELDPSRLAFYYYAFCFIYTVAFSSEQASSPLRSGFDSRYELCRKSWVFSGCSGFLPQGKLTRWVRINTVKVHMTGMFLFS